MRDESSDVVTRRGRKADDKGLLHAVDDGIGIYCINLHRGDAAVAAYFLLRLNSSVGD